MQNWNVLFATRPTFQANFSDTSTYEGWNFNSGNYLFTTDTE